MKGYGEPHHIATLVNIFRLSEMLCNDSGQVGRILNLRHQTLPTLDLFEVLVNNSPVL